MALPTFSIPIQRAALWSPEPLPMEPLPAFLDVAVGPPELGRVEPLLRRRLSPLGKGMLHAVGRISEGMGPLRSVFASRHGDPGRALPILADIAQGLDASPTQFSMNVHNAAAGIWSIATKDTSPATALAAGPETFGLALLEAFAQHQATGEAVRFVYGDDRLPELLAPYEEHPAPLHALAFLIGAPASIHLCLQRLPGGGTPSPQPQSLHALGALAGTEGAWVGATATWQWVWEPVP
ncbi:MAG TPA: beta-ketoacyl synthase chain length factor [Holophagaceae bacterium]|nr:beta-ketoacyl synthase chain length factor [Holophagaceae bacterium]